MIVLHDKTGFSSVTIHSCSVTIFGHLAWHVTSHINHSSRTCPGLREELVSRVTSGPGVSGTSLARGTVSNFSGKLEITRAGGGNVE